MIIKSIAVECGMESFSEVRPVFGGDINQAFCVGGKEKYFLKINEAARYPDLFKKEANGLNTLRGLTHCDVPEVIRYGYVQGNQYLLLQWMEPGRPAKNFWELFGLALAELHLRTQDKFGFWEDNYIGSLQQLNTEQLSWSEFYGKNRILPLVEQLYQNGSIEPSLVELAKSVCRKLHNIFPAEKPALLHGDLWSGNFSVTENGRPCIYDPAVYYGHREMDLGMTRLFGGFDNRFYEAYQESFPLEKNWESRIELTQLYPLLVHAVLFGGGYVNRIVSIIKKFG